MLGTELRGYTKPAGTLHILVTYVYLIAVREKGNAAGSSCICRQIFDYTGLKTLSKRLQLSLDTFVEINDSYTYFCHICDSQELKYFKYQDELMVHGHSSSAISAQKV